MLLILKAVSSSSLFLAMLKAYWNLPKWHLDTLPLLLPALSNGAAGRLVFNFKKEIIPVAPLP